MTTPDPTAALTAELAHLREDFVRLVDTFAQFGHDLTEIKTACAVLVERSNRTDADVRRLEDEVKALKDRRFPLPVVGALATVAALCLSVIGLLLTR